ncbi:MAG: hypothetical protein Q4A65_05980 [Bacillota bacterium]|nr:hypothetical protein [Bacillota bacterium]
MHSDMNTKEKLIAFKDIDEDILVTVAGQIPPQKRAGQIMSAGPKFWSVTDEATEGMVEANFYLCVTKDNLHFCILNSYNPDIVRRRVSFPLSEVEMTVTKEGHPNHVLLKMYWSSKIVIE